MDTEVYEVAILGAGLAGLGMGMKLKMAGEDSFVILEKEDRVGGTWRDNSYPGASCDVQSHLYWFSFDEQPDWSRVFALQPEIQANIERLVARRGLNHHIRLNAEVTEAVWLEERGHWLVTTLSGEQVRARAFVTAWGQLNRPSFKGIEGREHFDGVSWHSARWRHDVDLAGKRVASIGNGASAVQFIPEVAEVAGHLSVFQRTPNYCVPRLDRPYTDEERQLFLEDPSRLQESRDAFYWEHEGWIGAMKLQDNPVAQEFTRLAREHLESQVPDPELREKLWPRYPIGCKRLLIADTFYPALMRDNVELVTERIDRIEPAGVRTADGRLHEMDIIIYATGFETLSFVGHVEIIGRSPKSWPPRRGEGVSLRDAWREAPEAYLGMTVSGFPNLFILYGPNTNLGHNSIISMLECQFDYVLKALEAGRQKGAALDLKPEVLEHYNAQLQDELRNSSFAGNCNSWYKTPDGRITNNWSGSVEEYRQRTADLELAEYELVSADVLPSPEPSGRARAGPDGHPARGLSRHPEGVKLSMAVCTGDGARLRARHVAGSRLGDRGTVAEPAATTSSCRSAIRSRNQTFPAVWTASPNRTSHPFRTTSPLAMKGRPTALTAPSTFGTTRCRGGTGTSFRFAQQVSPSTAFDAQESSERGGGNALGLITVHAHTAPTGTSDHRPIRLRVQMAAASNGGTGMRA